VPREVDRQQGNVVMDAKFNGPLEDIIHGRVTDLAKIRETIIAATADLDARREEYKEMERLFMDAQEVVLTGCRPR